MNDGEVGKLPLQVPIDKHMINYGIRLLNKAITSYAAIIYTITLKLFISGEYKTQWLSRVKGILDNCGWFYIWLNQNRIDKSQCKSLIHKRIEDIAHQKWYIDFSNSSMCITYKLFKTQLHFEKHLLNSNCKDRINLTNLRCSNSKLPIYNTGARTNTPRENTPGKIPPDIYPGQIPPDNNARAKYPPDIYTQDIYPRTYTPDKYPEQ